MKNKQKSKSKQMFVTSTKIVVCSTVAVVAFLSIIHPFFEIFFELYLFNQNSQNNYGTGATIFF